MNLKQAIVNELDKLLDREEDEQLANKLLYTLGGIVYKEHAVNKEVDSYDSAEGDYEQE